MVVTHADRCPECGYVPGTVDGWRPLVDEVLHADGSVRLSFEASGSIRIAAQEVPLELRDVVVWDFDGGRIEGPKVFQLQPGRAVVIGFPGRKASQLWCEARLLGNGPAILQIYERP